MVKIKEIPSKTIFIQNLKSFIHNILATNRESVLTETYFDASSFKCFSPNGVKKNEEFRAMARSPFEAICRRESDMADH